MFRRITTNEAGLAIVAITTLGVTTMRVVEICTSNKKEKLDIEQKNRNLEDNLRKLAEKKEELRKEKEALRIEKEQVERSKAELEVVARDLSKGDNASIIAVINNLNTDMREIRTFLESTDKNIRSLDDKITNQA